MSGDDARNLVGEFERQGDGTWLQKAKMTDFDAVAGDLYGWSVALSGDVAYIGAPYTDNGSAYVVFGSDQGWNAMFDLTGLSIFNGNGFRIDGDESGDTLGKSVSAAGDINGDGIDDLVIGATEAGTTGAFAGAAYVVFGSTTGLVHPLDVSTLNGTNGFAIVGMSDGDSAGFSVSAAGDVNGDTIDDLLTMYKPCRFNLFCHISQFIRRNRWHHISKPVSELLYKPSVVTIHHGSNS